MRIVQGLRMPGLLSFPPDMDFFDLQLFYNRSRALGLTVGVRRSICTYGMIFGERSLKLKVTHATDVDLQRHVVEASAHRRFDVAGCRDKLDKLTELSRNAARRDGWSRLCPRLCPRLRRLGDKYRKELVTAAYALVNAATDYASDSNAPRMNPARVAALQFRCDSWVGKVLKQLRAGAGVPARRRLQARQHECRQKACGLGCRSRRIRSLRMPDVEMCNRRTNRNAQRRGLTLEIVDEQSRELSVRGTNQPVSGVEGYCHRV